MDVSPCDSPVRKYVDDYYSMRLSNDADPVSLSSLDVVDLDTTIVPDVFGLRAFDSESLITQMLPGQFRNELCVLIPDQGLSMTLSSLISAPPRNGGQAGLYPVTSLLSGGAGRGFCFTLCINARRRWRNSAVHVGTGRRWSSAKGILAIAPSAKNTW